MDFQIAVKSNNVDLMHEIFGGDDILTGYKVDIDGVSVEFISFNSRPGISESEVIINLLLGFAGGIPSSMIASWIYDKIMKNGKNKVILKEEKEILISYDNVNIFIKRKLERNE